jgi:hypothetical protein
MLAPLVLQHRKARTALVLFRWIPTAHSLSGTPFLTLYTPLSMYVYLLKNHALTNRLASHEAVPTERTQPQCIDLLAIALKYQIPSAVHSAKHSLLASHMSPPLQLNLGRRFGFNDWVGEAAHAIIHIPILSFTPSDIELIGPNSTCLLIELHSKLADHRSRTSLMLPALLSTHAFGCRNPVKCLAHWKDVCLLLNKQIVRPGSPLTDIGLLETIKTEETVGILMGDMSVECAQQVKVKCRESLVGKDMWLKDSVINRLSSQ